MSNDNKNKVEQSSDQYRANKQKFWIACPHCKKKFGVEPMFVIKYLDRLVGGYKTRLDSLENMLIATQADIDHAKAKNEEGGGKRD